MNYEWARGEEHAKGREHLRAPVASTGECGIFQEMKGQYCGHLDRWAKTRTCLTTMANLWIVP